MKRSQPITEEEILTQSYNGNLKLKKAGVKIPWTMEELDEIERCREDVVYFAAKYCKIVSLDRGLVNFEMYDYQKEIIQIMDDNRFSIFLLARQSGKSITVAAYLLHQAIFNPNWSIAVLANKGDQAREIIGRIKLMYEELPWFIQVGVITWNEGSIKLGNRTKIFSANTKGSSVRGKSINLMYLDEFAFVEDDVKFYTSVYPTVTSGTTTKVIITSTPNGMNLFYKLWTDAKFKRNEFKCKQVFWHETPGRDESFKTQQLKNMTEKQWQQEYECQFHGSADTLISGRKLQSLTYTDPIYKEDGLTIYEHPVEGHSYVATADTAEGVGKDFSVLSIFDVTSMPYKHVATYRDNEILPIQFAEKVFKLSNKYNEAALVVEANSVGGITAEAVWGEWEYENMLTTRVKDSENAINTAGKSIPGIKTTTKTKAIGCAALKSLIEGDTLIVTDFETVSELSTFIKDKKSYAAEKGKNDDIAMTLVLFSWFTIQPYFADMVDLNVKGLIKKNLDEVNGFALGYLDDGTQEPEPIMMH